MKFDVQSRINDIFFLENYNGKEKSLKLKK